MADTVINLAKVVSVSSVHKKSKEKSDKIFGDSSLEVMFDKQVFNKVEDRRADGEITGECSFKDFGLKEGYTYGGS
nr:kinesin, motor domain-containing protein [Tanacetum cinerariifolium]